jgi:hypothetical protein
MKQLTKEDIIADYIISNNRSVIDEDKRIYIFADHVIDLMEQYNKQQTASMYSEEDLIRALNRGADFNSATANTIKYDCLDDLLKAEFLTPPTT